MMRTLSWFAAALSLTCVGAALSHAQTVVWDGEDGTPFWSHDKNWISVAPPVPVNDIPPYGIVEIGVFKSTQDVMVLLDENYGTAPNQLIFQLVLAGGADLINSPNGGVTANQLYIGSDTVISKQQSPGSSITIFGDGLNTLGTTTIQDGSSLNLNSQMAAGSAVVRNGAFVIDPGGAVFGNGRIELLPSAAPAFRNKGTLSAGAFGLFLDPPATQLQITWDGFNSIVDLDGATNSGVVNVFKNAMLRIDAPRILPFGGDLNLHSGATLRVSSDWTIDGGTVDVNTDGIVFGTPGPAAHLSGAPLNFAGGVMTLDAIDALVIDAPFTAAGGVISNGGTITINSVATIQAEADFKMTGVTSKIIVNNVVRIDMPDFDLDGDGTPLNVTTINGGGYLDLNLGNGADEDFNHTINLLGGTLDVTTADKNWSVGAGSVVNASGPASSVVTGNLLRVIGYAEINVATGSELHVNAPLRFEGNSTVNVGANALLDFDTATFANSSARYIGAGTLYSGDATIVAATTWSLATVNLDDGNVTLFANLTINANSIDDDGDGFDRVITINDGTQLTVNIAGAGAWALDSAGAINYNGDLAGNDSYLGGSSIALNGSVNHSGAGRIDARLNIGATGRININGDKSVLSLNGGDSSTSPNTMSGGAVDGAGSLLLPGGRELRGFGAINVPVSGSGGVWADNGVLTLKTTFQLVQLGAADADGILNIPNPWDTSQVSAVELLGGELRGAAITNSNTGGIGGHGLVSAKIINNTRIDAKKTGVLLLNNSANDNDWDGVTGIGQLNADAAELELRDNASFPFTGTITAVSGGSVFANGFPLEFEPGSTLKLAAGRFRSTHSTNFGGNVSVLPGGASTVAIQGIALFEGSGTTTLRDDLQLDSSLTTIQANAQLHAVAAGATLVVHTGTLRLLDGATLDVPIENQSIFDLGTVAAAGHAAAGGFQQTASGLWALDLGGTGVNEFDSLDLTGSASLDGTLVLSRVNGFVPSFGQTFEILTAEGGISGKFAAVLATMPRGLKIDVIYKPESVTLKVSSASMFTADFDHDLDVDRADLSIWKAAFHINNLGDADGDGDSDGVDFLFWQRQVGLANLTSNAALAPEPSSYLHISIGLAVVTGCQRWNSRRRRAGRGATDSMASA